MLPSTNSVLQETQIHSNKNLLDETQRLIEEAELKLRCMEAGINHDTNSLKPTVYSSVDEPQLSSRDSKNHRLKQVLDYKMRKLEKQLETHWKKQVTVHDTADPTVDPSRTFSIVDAQKCKRNRVRRPCRKVSEADHGPQDVVDVVRTARDSVHGALLAAQKLSASLDSRTPRLSRRSASVTSLRPTNELQTAESDSAHFCLEHGTKRKVCSCLLPNFEGLKQENKVMIGKEKETHPCEVINLAPRKSNVGVFQAECTSSTKEVNRPITKRLEVSVMPSLTIKRSLEKHVMPVIEVPFPGSTPNGEKRENTGVRNFRHADPEESVPEANSAFAQQVCCRISHKGQRSTPVPLDGGVQNIPASCTIGPQSSSQELRDLDPTQLKQVLEFILEKMTSSQTDTNSNSQHPPPDQETLLPTKSDRLDESQSERSSVKSARSSQNTKHDEHDGAQDPGGSVTYDSLTRFLQTYSKAAVESKRVRQKAAERRKKEERNMKAEERRFKSVTDNQLNEGSHGLIGPFRRAILKGNLRRSNASPFMPSSNQKGNKLDPVITLKEDNADQKVMELDLKNGSPDEKPSKVPDMMTESSPSLESIQHSEEKHLESESDGKSDDVSQSSSRSKSKSGVSPVHGAPPQSPSKRNESSNDEYEDDWEEDNEGENNTEERVETRDVGDGSERDTRDEITDGLAHTLRTIIEVEENSSLSVSLVHHEPLSQPTESGPIKAESQPPSKSSLTEADLMPTQTDKAQLDSNSVEIPQRTVVGKEMSKSSETAEPVAKPRSEEFSSSRAFLEMTESLKKMLETVVTNLVQNKPQSVVPDIPSSKKRGVRFESGHRSRIRSYDPSSCSPDDRLSSGSEASYSRSLRWNTQANRRPSSRVRFKTGSKRNRATQTEVDDDDDVKRDAGTQVTPLKEREEKSYGWQMPGHLYLRPSTLSLECTTLRPSSRPISLSFDMDPTERLLAFGKSASCQMKGVPAFGGGVANVLKSSPELQRRGSVSQCDSLSSSSYSVLPTDGLEYTANNTIRSLSEGEVLAYHSCSCSEGEICLCAGICRGARDNYDGSMSAKRVLDEPVIAEGASFIQNPWSFRDSTAAEDLMDLSDHFSEGEVIEKLIGISHLLNGTANERKDPFDSNSNFKHSRF